MTASRATLDPPAGGLRQTVARHPVAGMLIGILALGEHLSTSSVALGFETAAAVVMVAGTWMLGRSPLICGRYHPAEIAKKQLREIEALLLPSAPAKATPAA